MVIRVCALWSIWAEILIIFEVTTDVDRYMYVYTIHSPIPLLVRFLGHPVCLKQLAWSQLEIGHGFEPQPRRRVQVFLPPGVIAPLMGARQLLVGLLVPYRRPGAVTPIALPNLFNGHSAFSNRWYQHFLTKTLMIVLQPNCVCWIGLNQVQVDKIDCHCIERGECTQTYSAYFSNGW